MNDLEGIYRHIVRDLELAGRESALIGGLAVSTRAQPRFTGDIDLAIGVSGDPVPKPSSAGSSRRGIAWRR